MHPAACALQEDVLLAYQVGFDLYENEMQSFLQKVSSSATPVPSHLQRRWNCPCGPIPACVHAVATSSNLVTPEPALVT